MGVEVQKRSVETQSVFRESEAQTDAYSPPHQFSGESIPEVFLIKDIVTSKKLPLSENEIAAIEKLRQKRLMDSKLPPTTDEFSLHCREQLVDSAEFAEWKNREKIITELQKRKLELIKEALRKREKAKEELSREKIERIRIACLEKHNLHSDISQINRLKQIQKINKVFASFETLLKENDKSIIALYENYASAQYVPLARNGYTKDYISLEIPSPELDSYPAIVALEKSIPLHVKRPILPDKEPNILKESTLKRREYKQHGNALERLFNTLSGVSMSTFIQDGSESVDKADNFMKSSNAKNTTILSTHIFANSVIGNATQSVTALLKSTQLTKRRLDKNSTLNQNQNHTNNTQSVDVENGETLQTADEAIESENKNRALLLLQRLIRGRAIQNEMREGRERRRDLIDELKIGNIFNTKQNESHVNIFDNEIELNNGQKVANHVIRQQFDDEWNDNECEELSRCVVEFAQAEIISNTLSDLNRELGRFQEARRIAAMAEFAERERRKRQALEAGARQREEMIRNRQDVLFREIMGVEYSSVESFLEEILVDTVAENAKATVLSETRLRSQYMNSVLDELEDSQLHPEAMIHDLFSSFLLPHVKRETIRRRIENVQNKFQLTAASLLHDTLHSLKEDVVVQRNEEAIGGASASQEGDIQPAVEELHENQDPTYRESGSHSNTSAPVFAPVFNLGDLNTR